MDQICVHVPGGNNYGPRGPVDPFFILTLIPFERIGRAFSIDSLNPGPSPHLERLYPPLKRHVFSFKFLIVSSNRYHNFKGLVISNFAVTKIQLDVLFCF